MANCVAAEGVCVCFPPSVWVQKNNADLNVSLCVCGTAKCQLSSIMVPD